jgi:chromosome partition protein MukB
MPSPEDFFSLNEISARRLLLIGYRLFPATDLLLHPRMTVLSGNNAVGKTTILDAVQTIFICNLRHINLNVASGHSDRNLSGQLAGQIAWSCLEVTGHEKIKGIGVRLRKKPGSEGVELSPFVLEEARPELSLFLNEESLQITSDLQFLSQTLLQTDPAARVLPFESVDAFHRLLHAEGLFPIDLSGSGKQLFSNLWRQVSQPRLDRLRGFLEEMLCPRRQVKKLGFDEVERLIKDRRTIEAGLTRLEKFRQIRRELEDRLSRLDHYRLECLGLSLALAGQQLRLLLEQKDQNLARQNAVHEQRKQCEQELNRLQADVRSKREQRDMLLRRQTDLAIKLRHHQEYQQALSAIPEVEKGLDQAGLAWKQCRERITKTQAEIEDLNQSLAAHEKDLAVGREREKQLASEAGEWKALLEAARECEALFRTPVDSKEAFQRVRQDFQPEWQAFQSLKSMKRELKVLEKRKTEHQAALRTRQSLVRLAPELEAAQLEPGVLKTVGQDWKQERQKLWDEQHTIQNRVESLQRDWDQLAKGRPPLPEGPASLVDRGLARPFAARFEHMDLEEAAAWQARIGPFAQALEFTDDAGSGGLSDQRAPFLVVRDSHGPDSADWSILARSEHGILAGRSGLGWYTPEGPVWLGAQARSRQMSRMKKDLLDLEQRLTAIHQELGALQEKEGKATELLHTWQAYADDAAPVEHDRLCRDIERLEGQGPVIQKKNRLLNDLMQRTHAFLYRNAPRDLETLQEEMAGLKKRLKELNTRQKKGTERLRQLQDEESRLETQHREHQQEKSKLETRCETLRREEPLEVLEGRIDFQKETELQERIEALEQECSRLDSAMDERKHSLGAFTHELAGLSDSLARGEREIEKTKEEESRAREDFQTHYPEHDIPVYSRPTEF